MIKKLYIIRLLFISIMILAIDGIVFAQDEIEELDDIELAALLEGNGINTITRANHRGLLMPVDSATISSRVNATINDITIKNGQSFDKNQLLIRFDCDELVAKRNVASAELIQKKAIYSANVDANSRGVVAKMEMIRSKQNVNVARANLQLAKTKIQNCEITAPFDGTVANVMVKNHEAVREGDSLFTLLKNDDLEVVMFLPSIWLNWLNHGMIFNIKIDETSQTYPVEVSMLGANIDPASRTVEVRGKFIRHAEELISGMSGIVEFPDS